LRLIVGCPIAHRAWALPLWFEHLAAQSRRPDAFAFIHGGLIGDETWQAIEWETARHGFPVQVRHDERWPHPRHDNQRFHTLVDLRNQLLDLARDELEADLFLSLDSDVMLEDTSTIATLERMIAEGECELAAPATWLHPQGEGSFAYNAGWWQPGGSPEDPRRAWKRPEPDKVPWGDVVPIDVPMAAWLGNRNAMACAYRWHEGGEDLGFAQSIESEGVRCLWDTALKCRHVWCEQDLEGAVAA
jgi:hypothetical protein